jgi:hypothetical protein
MIYFFNILNFKADDYGVSREAGQIHKRRPENAEFDMPNQQKNLHK